MCTAIKHLVPDWVKPSFAIVDIRPDVKTYQWRLNPVWLGMLYGCTHMATVGVKGLNLFHDHSCNAVFILSRWHGW